MNHQADPSLSTETIFDGRYYIINKRLLQFIGQWPYQYDKDRLFKFWFIFFLSCSVLAPQIRSLILTWGKLDTFVACFTPMIANIGCLGMLINSEVHIPQLRKILDETIKNWDNMNRMSRAKILRNHGETGRLFTIMYSLVCYSVILGWILTPLLPKVLDLVVPLNHSRKRIDMIPTDYMVDSDKFFWAIFFHLGGAIVVILSILVAIDSFYMSLAQHACGMFEILRTDLENALPEDQMSLEIDLQPDYHSDAMYQHIVSCMKRHKSLVQYVNSIQSTCEWMLFVVVWASVVVLSFTAYQTVAKSTPREDVLRMGLFSIAQTYHLYGITLPGHWIAEESAFLATSVYSCKWYMMSMRSRKLVLLFIRASIEPCAIIAGKIYVMSVENFCMVLQTAVSYLTMLTSFQ